MTVFCVTNEMDDARSCTVKGQHETICDGWQYHYDAIRGIEIATGKPCTGCQPREAKKGMLCWSCWERVEQAFVDWTPELESALYRNDRLVQRDNGGIRSQIVGYVNLPATSLALNEVNSYLKSWTTSTDLWVCTVDGAKDAVRFARAVGVAKRSHEIEEKQRQMQRVRCPKCGQLSFVRNPPEDFEKPVTIKCQTEGCGKLITDQAKVVEVAAIERTAREAAMKRLRA